MASIGCHIELIRSVLEACRGQQAFVGDASSTQNSNSGPCGLPCHSLETNTLVYLIAIGLKRWYLLVLLIGAYYRFRISSTEEKLQEMKVESQKKLEAFKENGTYKEVSSLMAQLEARTPRRGPAGGMRAPDGKPFAGKPQAPSTEPRSKRTGMSQPMQGDAATVKVAPSTVAVKRTKGGDKGADAALLDAPAVRHASSDPTLTSSTTTTEEGENASKKSGNGTLPPSSHLGSSAPSSSQPSSSQPSSAKPSSNGSSNGVSSTNQQPHRLHLNPVPQSPYRGQYVAQGQQQQSPSSSSPSSSKQESKGWMDWFVDKLVGSEATTPKWCAFCGAHNGLIPVDELQNVRFVCHNCKAYNSPEVMSQLKSMQGAKESPSSSTATSPSETRSEPSPSDSASPPSSSDASDEVTPIRERSKPKRQRISQIGTEEEKD